MKYKDIIKEIESIGVEIDYMEVDIDKLDEECDDPNTYRGMIMLKSAYAETEEKTASDCI